MTEIGSAAVEDSYGRKILILTHSVSGKEKLAKTKCKPLTFVCEQGNLLNLFGKYWGRHQHALSRQ